MLFLHTSSEFLSYLDNFLGLLSFIVGVEDLLKKYI